MIFDEKKNLDFYRNLGIEGRYAKAVDFLQNTFRNHIFPFRQRQALEEFLHFANGKLRHLGNILPVYIEM